MVTSVEEAYAALRPLEVIKASYTETPVTRQGDVFAVETLLTTGELRAMGARILKRTDALKADVSGTVARVDELKREAIRLHGTNHESSEVATLPDGRMFARGCLYHNPDRRRADHARRRIGNGKAWHEVFTNTVPRFRGQSLAWSGFGRVD